MADHYDAGFGTVWRSVADQMIARIPVPINSYSIIHDNGCGTGQVTDRIMHHLHQANSTGGDMPTIYATDLSKNMIKELQAGQLGPHLQHIRSSVMDSESLQFENDFFTHSFCSITLMACANPEGICKEIYRTLKPGGIAIASTWSSFGYTPIVEKAMSTIRPNEKHSYRPPVPPGWETKEAMEQAFRQAGFAADKVEVVLGKTHCTLEEIKEGMDHFCEAVTLQVAVGWTDDERKELYRELRTRFTAGKGDNIQEFDMNPWIGVARK